MATRLEALIHPASKTEFFAHYQASEPYVVHGLNETVRELTDLPFLESLDALLNSWPKDVKAHLPDVADEARSIDATPADGRRLFNNGMGLMFENPEDISPVLNHWLAELRCDLGLSALTLARCLVYATPEGKGTAPHFDQNINLVLQVHGSKRWRVAPNEHVSNPMTRHTMGLPMDPELESYIQAPMPTRMPAGSDEFILKPGSLLFVPRGSWHTTESKSDALSLNFTFSAPTWIDIFSAALRRRLAQSSQWRETADGFFDEEGFSIAASKFDGLLAELKHEMPTWQAARLLAATEMHHAPEQNS